MNKYNSVVVLISCMHEKDHSILDRANIQSDAVVVNQCDRDLVESFDYIDKNNIPHKVCFVSTTQRGLSKSRNMAISYAKGHDIVLICDDDEVLADRYNDEIINAYNRQDADVIAFAIRCDQYSRTYSEKELNLGFSEILKTSSQQISCSLNAIGAKQIAFDEKMGSGTGNGPGEETKFLLSCRKQGLKMRYNPYCVATIIKGDSQWFHGYTEKYFQNQGWVDRRLLGPVLGLAYIFYWTLFRKSEYKNDGISVSTALKNSLKGYFSKR